MRATRELPEGYRLVARLDLKRDKRAAVFINLAAAPLLFVFGWGFLSLAGVLAPSAGGAVGLEALPAALPGFVAALLGVIVLHEAAHGLLFFLFTRELPRFGFGGLYAYAAAPDWYVPRGMFLSVALAPLVLLTALGLALVPSVPPAALLPLVLFLTLNAAGSVGDLYVACRVLVAGPGALVRDYGVGFELHAPRVSGTGAP